MQKTYPVLLIGLLSMLFAEIMSGASTMWFLEPLGILLTFPLYLFHVLFFLWLAFEFERTELHYLYLFGVIFALYESWVTKVLWAGYMDAAGPGLGTFSGVAIAEFSVLVFFWHPVMSFMAPILVFEILSRKAFAGHTGILKDSRKRKLILIVCILFISTFIAQGNSFNLLSANTSVLGTLLLVSLAYKASMDADLRSFHIKRAHFKLVTAYLFILYIITFLFLLPERIPSSIGPYLPIILFYLIPTIIILRSERSDIRLMALPEGSFDIKDIGIFSLILILAVNIACLVPPLSSSMMAVAYISMMFAGPVFFLTAARRCLKHTGH